MTEISIRILRGHEEILDAQNCVLGDSSLLKEFKDFDDKSLDSFAGIRVQKLQSRILVRLSRTNLSDGARSFTCDFRVQELLGSYPGSGEEQGNEIDLAKRVVEAEEENRNTRNSITHILQPSPVLSQGELRRTMRFNDALCCTSKDVQILKSGTIKLMRLTVISPSALVFSRKSESPHKGLLLLEEKVRDILISYDFHLRPRTFVNLTKCPLAQHAPLAISALFVESLEMKSEEVEIGRVTSSTRILIKNLHHISYYERKLASSAEHFPLYGLEKEERMIRDLINFGLRLKGGGNGGKMVFPSGVLIAGPPGSGKTLVVRETVRRMEINLFLIDLRREDLESFSGGGAIFREAIESSYTYPTLLLLESLDDLNEDHKMTGRKTEKNGMSKRRKLVDELADLFDSLGDSSSFLSVVGTARTPHSIPPKIRLRLKRESFIRPPREPERLGILRNLFRNSFETPRPASEDEERMLALLAKETPGYVPADLIRLTHLLFNNGVVGGKEIRKALAQVGPSVLRGGLGVVDVSSSPTTLEDIAGLESLKLDLIKAIVWPLKHTQAFRRMNITPTKGILLYGPPGCAKTSIVRALAASYQTNFLSTSAAELFSSAVGDSEKIVSDLFYRARIASPSILFIDELDSIVGSRQTSKSRGKSANESILSMLLTEMDGVGVRAETIPHVPSTKEEEEPLGPHVIVVAATNRPDLIDPALTRPGRFDRIIPVPPPDESGRLSLLQKLTQNMPLSESVDLHVLAKETEFYSGADLVNLCREAALFALAEDMDIQSVSMKHLKKARAETTPSLSLQTLASFHEYSTAAALLDSTKDL